MGERSDLKNLKSNLGVLPNQPGVYLFRDKSGRVIYVGKAASLKKRVSSYFRNGSPADPKTNSVVSEAADFDYIVANSEQEALILECNLIKEYKPRYNSRLKDDKKFPYLKLTTAELFPRLLIDRQVANDGSKYFGPYTDVQMIRNNLNLLRRLFPVRTCSDRITSEGSTRRDRPCLDYWIDQCSAPCVKKIDVQGYQKIIKDLISFLSGGKRKVLSQLKKKMKEHSEKLEFERAARVKNQIRAFEKLTSSQVITTSTLDNRDCIGMAVNHDLCCLAVLFIREGRVKGKETLFMEVPPKSRPEEILSSFVKQFYMDASFIPKEILLPNNLDDKKTTGNWLSGKKGNKVYLKVPQRGDKRKIVKMANRNAQLTLGEEEIKHKSDRKRNQILKELQDALGLRKIPNRMEAYDISQVGGTKAVGSMVVFEGGLPKKSDYRRFKIETVQGVDDYGMMEEVLMRRFKHGLREQKATPQSFSEWAHWPDLILIDGGKGQLKVAQNVLTKLDLTEVEAMGLAKENEEIFLPRRKSPLNLPSDSKVLHLLQHIRDEAHRFALSYHRTLRKRSMSKSALDSIRGVGPARKKAILNHFGSLANLKNASLAEISSVPGLPEKVAQRIYRNFSQNVS